jgi:RluA family pseudouridine synthase
VSLTVLLQEGGLVAIAKPPGRLVVPGRVQADGTAGLPSLQESLAAQLGRRVWVVHRLDRDTSGVLVFALDAATHRRLSQAFEQGDVTKTYVALVEGQLRSPSDINAPLTEARKRTMRVALPGEPSKEALTVVTPIRQWSHLTWVSCQPRTGRQHQIRVHLRHVGHPLAVDPLYGRCSERSFGSVLLRRTPLHAATLEIEGLRIEAPVPADLREVLDALGDVAREA